MKRTLIYTFVILCGWVSVSRAQSTNYCDPQAETTPVVLDAASIPPVMEVRYCSSEKTVVSANTIPTGFVIDNTVFMLQPICQMEGNNIGCHATLPVTGAALLNTPGSHISTLGVFGKPLIQVQTRELGIPAPCPYTPPNGVAGTRPVGYGIEGHNNIAGQLLRIDQLRHDGWRVDWSWAPIGSTEKIYIMAWCVDGNTPQ